jgi:hypothetical protein
MYRRSDRAHARRGERVPERLRTQVVTAVPDAVYAPPPFLRQVLAATELDGLRALLTELKAANDEQVGRLLREQWVLLNGDPALLAWQRALCGWIERYADARAARPHPRDRGEPFRTFARLVDELMPWLDALEAGGTPSAPTLHRLYVEDMSVYLAWCLFQRTWGRQVRLVATGDGARVFWEALPEAYRGVAYDLIDEWKWAPDPQLDALVRALGGPGPDDADDRLADLAEDLTEMRPLLMRGFKPERTLVEVGPGVFAAWSWNVGQRVGTIITGETERTLREHLSMAMSDRYVDVRFDGAIADRHQRWRTMSSLPGGKAASLRLLEPLHARLFSFYDRIDLDAVVRRGGRRPGGLASADAVVAASCEVLRQKGGRGRNQSLGVRTTELFAVLQRLGCEIRSAKGSEIAIYRPGAKIWTLTHHKRNPRVGWATVRRMLQRLQIPMESWLAAIR